MGIDNPDAPCNSKWHQPVATWTEEMLEEYRLRQQAAYDERAKHIHAACLPGVTLEDAYAALDCTAYNGLEVEVQADIAVAIRDERQRVLKALSHYLEHESVTTIAAMDGFAMYLASL